MQDDRGEGRRGAASTYSAIRRYWDADAPTYERSPEHVPHTAAQQSAWKAAVERHLPPPPARVLEVGAGTGFLSVLMAELGYTVTALDLSSGMLEVLRRNTSRAQVHVDVVEATAESPPPGPFDAVVERLLLWTLVDPARALQAWRETAPGGRLVSFGGLWEGDPAVLIRRRLQRYVRRIRRDPPEHHAPYPVGFEGVEELPRAHPSYVIRAVESAGWKHVRVERLRDVEWAQALALPLSLRVFGVTPEFAVIADA